MQKSKLVRKGRKGFTLVEVALAVAVGLIIIGGAVLGYNAVKDNASNSNARNRVLSGVTMVEEYAAANGGQFPDSANAGGSFTQMWEKKRPDDKATSPWGGTTGAEDGVDENDPVVAASLDASAAVAAADITVGDLSTVANAENAANMNYVSLTKGTGSEEWASYTAGSTASKTTFKNYAVGIADKTGIAFWDVKGGK